MKSGSAWSPLRSWLGIFLVAAMALSVAVIAGCGAKRSTPEKAAEAYLKAMKKSDIDAMLDCCAPDLRRILEAAIKEEGKEKVAKRMAGSGKLGSFTVGKAEVKGDWAQVEVSMTVDGKKETEKLILHKIKGEWLSDIPREMKFAPELIEEPKGTEEKPEKPTE